MSVIFHETPLLCLEKKVPLNEHYALTKTRGLYFMATATSSIKKSPATDWLCTINTQVSSFLPEKEKADKISQIIFAYSYSHPDLEAIYKGIEAGKTGWQGNRDINFTFRAPTPGLAGSHARPEWWGRFAQFMNADTSGYVSDGINRSKNPGKVAVDLGCGNSDATITLLKQGWKVIAVDYAQKALSVLGTRVLRQVDMSILKQKRFVSVCSPVEKYVWPDNVDLVVANSIFPYSDPECIRSLITNIHCALNHGGIFVGNFFSSRLVKAQKTAPVEKEMGAWFMAKDNQAAALLKLHGFEVLKTVAGSSSNPHSITFIAQKP